jgi:hypothetical protein
MLKLLGAQFFIIHLVACFWYFGASVDDNPYNNWVGARGLIGKSKGYIYFNAFYWAF